jgi:hypothetical protein
MPDNLQFGTAQYAPPPTPPAPAPSADGAFPRALLFGIVGAAIGMALYAGFVIATNIVVGYVSLAVGFIVAKAILLGSKGVGGRQYQIAAALLTYCAVSMSVIPIVLYQTHLSLSDIPLGKLIQVGLTSPFLELKTDPGHGVIGLIILFVGVSIAWKMTAAKPHQ